MHSRSKAVLYTQPTVWGRVPEAGASKVGAAFDANHTRLNTKARGEPGGEILGVFSDHYEHLLLLKK